MDNQLVEELRNLVASLQDDLDSDDDVAVINTGKTVAIKISGWHRLAADKTQQWHHTNVGNVDYELNLVVGHSTFSAHYILPYIKSVIAGDDALDVLRGQLDSANLSSAKVAFMEKLIADFAVVIQGFVQKMPRMIAEHAIRVGTIDSMLAKSAGTLQ